MSNTRKTLHFLGGVAIIAAILTALFSAIARLGPAVELENRIDDAARAHFTPEAPAPHPAVAVVALDEATLTAYPPFSPIDRSMLARLLEILYAAQPRAVGVDIFFADATRPDADQQLAQVLAGAPVPVVIATALQDGLPLPLAPAFQEQGIEFGMANLPVDRSDGVLRRFRPAIRDSGGRYQPTLATQLLEAATGEPIEQSDELRPIDWYGRPLGSGANPPSIAIFPAHTLLSVPAAANLLRGKVILVGATFAASNDFVKTPFSSADADKNGIPGVLAHAQILAQLIDGRSRPVAPPALGWLLTAVGLIISAAFAMARPSAPAAVVVAIAVPVLWIAVGLYVRGSWGFQLPSVAPALAFGAGVGAFSAYRARRLDRMQRQALRALSQRVPAGVIDRMMTSPDLLRTDGEAREITVLFTDLASFTRFSSERSAPEVMRFLRDYLEEVSELVLTHGGTIDKFIGDAVMAFWGAPLEQPDHAQRAIACAREIDAKCRRLAKRHDLTTRIGVHTGQAMVGFIGSRKRLEYTAIGDTVNTASRVEGANKYLRTTLCVTGTAIEASGNDPTALGLRFVARVRLSGRAEIEALYTTVPDVYGPQETSRYVEAAVALDRGGLERAKALFDCLPRDDVVEFQLDRCRLGTPGVVTLADK